MLKDKVKEIREKSLEQLYKDVNSLYTEIRESRFKTVNREVKDTTKKKKLRKKVAQILTVIHEKELENVLKNVEANN